MKRLGWISITLIVIGLSILVAQSIQHILAARQGRLRPFDEDGVQGEQIRVLLPFAGTVCLGAGIFLFVLTSGRKTP